MEKVKSESERISNENSDLNRKLQILLEEKNFFINSKFLKNSCELSFIDEKSQEMNQSKLLGFGASSIQPIPIIN